MSVLPTEILEFSRAHLEDNSELSKRCSVSKAYYAAFHRAKEVFGELEPDTACEIVGGLHKTYIDTLLQEEAGSIKREVGVKLQAMHSRRVRADYKLAINIKASDPALQISTADLIFNMLDQSQIKIKESL